jgi:hypothetical protein
VWASAACAGPRRGELRALRWSNVVGLDDATGRRIEVEHSWDDKTGEILPKTKGRSPAGAPPRDAPGNRESPKPGVAGSSPVAPAGLAGERAARGAWTLRRLGNERRVEGRPAQRQTLGATARLPEGHPSFVGQPAQTNLTRNSCGGLSGGTTNRKTIWKDSVLPSAYTIVPRATLPLE